MWWGFLISACAVLCYKKFVDNKKPSWQVASLVQFFYKNPPLKLL